MTLGRRTAFFMALAAVSLLLWEPTPAEYRWVNLFAAGLATVWAVAVAIEDRSLGRWRPPNRKRGSKPGSPPEDPSTRV